MSAPTAPTLATLVSEALKKAGQSNPSSALTTRAQDQWMEEIKNDVLVMAGGRKLKPLYTTSISVTVDGKGRYSNPTDYFSDMTIEILDGVNRGTATAGASGSITLGKNEGDIVGSEILVTSGTGVGSMSQCASFNSSTLVATVSPNFTTAPTNGSTYMIIDRFYRLTEEPIFTLDNGINLRGVPSSFYPLGDADYGEFELSPTPYNTDSHVFGIRMRYYANLLTLDLAGTLISTLYQRWRNLWVNGVTAKALDELNDTRTDKAYSIYKESLSAVVYRDAYGLDMSNLQPKVMDY